METRDLHRDVLLVWSAGRVAGVSEYYLGVKHMWRMGLLLYFPRAWGGQPAPYRRLGCMWAIKTFGNLRGATAGRWAVGFEWNAAPRKEMLGFGWELGV